MGQACESGDDIRHSEEDTIKQMCKYLMDFVEISLALDVYRNWWNPLDLDQTQLQDQRSRPTLSTPSFCRIDSSTTFRSRHLL
ncbi:hypothetical protein BC941DRAFT_469986 [Chlamydoabsidia padenii]|nr:hypothetical protein BC941DRAFT_469986 [Chlamydoabsidia padenii]